MWNVKRDNFMMANLLVGKFQAASAVAFLQRRRG
jgi:hypothetical protein